MMYPIIFIFGKLTIIIIVIIIFITTMAILMSIIILIHMSMYINNKSDLRTGFMIWPIISIFGMLTIPSLPHPLTLHPPHHQDGHPYQEDRHADKSYLSLSNVSDPGAGRHSFQDPKDSDILAEAARDDKEEAKEEEEL